MVDCELNLLQEASSRMKYDYYHILSGQDLPIKTQDYIHEFFDSVGEKEFVGFYSTKFSCDDRVRLCHLFCEYIGKSSAGFFCSLESLFIRLQRMLHISKNINVSFQKGTNWASITDSLAKDLVLHRKWIEKIFRFSFAPDELYKQTFIINHPNYI